MVFTSQFLHVSRIPKVAKKNSEKQLKHNIASVGLIYVILL